MISWGNSRRVESRNTEITSSSGCCRNCANKRAMVGRLAGVFTSLLALQRHVGSVGFQQQGLQRHLAYRLPGLVGPLDS